MAADAPDSTPAAAEPVPVRESGPQDSESETDAADAAGMESRSVVGAGSIATAAQLGQAGSVALVALRRGSTSGASAAAAAASGAPSAGPPSDSAPLSSLSAGLMNSNILLMASV